MLRISPYVLQVDVKAVYSMTAGQLKTEFRKAADSRSSSSKLWDALMYRASIFRSDFSINDVSVIIDSFANFGRFKSMPFLKFLVQPFFEKADLTDRVSLLDLTMILYNIRKLGVLNESEMALLLSRFSPAILLKLTNQTKPDDLARVASALGPYADATARVRIEELAANMSKLSVKNLVILFDFFTRTGYSPTMVNDEEEPFYKAEKVSSEFGASIPFLARLLNETIAASPRFNHKDVFLLTKSLQRLDLKQLDLLGHPSRVAIDEVIGRCIVREAANFKPIHLVELFIMQCPRVAVIEKELIYRIRDISASNCVRILLERSNIPAELMGAITARLCRFDTKNLSTDSVVQLGRVVSSQPTATFAKQMMKPLISKFRQNPFEMVEVYSSLGVRDVTEMNKIVSKSIPHILSEVHPEPLWRFAKGLSKLGLPIDHRLRSVLSQLPLDQASVNNLIEVMYIENFSKASVSDILPVPQDLVEISASLAASRLAETPGHPWSEKFASEFAPGQPPLRQPGVDTLLQRVSVIKGVKVFVDCDHILVQVESLSEWLTDDRPQGVARVCDSIENQGDWIALFPTRSDDFYFESSDLKAETLAHIGFVKSKYTTVVVDADASIDTLIERISSL